MVEALLAAAQTQSFSITRLSSLAELEAELAGDGGQLPVDALLLDLGLPDGDGLASFQRASHLLPETAILVLTGTDDRGMALAAVAGGAQDYLVKGNHDGPGLAKAIAFAIERKSIERRVRVGEASVARMRQVASVAQLAHSTASELQPAIELAMESGLSAGRALSALQEAMAAASPHLDPALRARVVGQQQATPDAFKSLLDALSLLQETANSLRLLGETAGLAPAWVDLHHILRRVLMLTQARWRPRMRVTTRLAFELPLVVCDPAGIEMVVTELMKNAIEAFERVGRTDGNLVISTGCDQPWVWMRVSDDGPGVEPALRPRLFEVFNSTKPLGQGGVGLARVRNVLEGAGGSIAIEHRDPGTDVLIRLPAPAA
jgi:signal transduction histidine kinase